MARKERSSQEDIYRQLRPGAAPGTLAEDPTASPPRIHLLAYGPEGIEEAEVDLDHLGEAVHAARRYPVAWFDVVGVDHASSMHRIGEIFGLHPLVIEDAADTYQRPKADPYGEQVFIVLRVPEAGPPLDLEQISIVVGPRLALTFQERNGNCFHTVRQRIREGRTQLRNSGPDYLTYAIIDAALDSYFPVLEDHGERLEELELKVLSDPDPATLNEVQRLKRDLRLLRRSVWPYREMLSLLSREDSEVFSTETRVFLRDCYDHTVQLMDLVESYREIGSGLIDLHMSSVSNRMNDVMKTLTMIATLFIPLSFITGVYGMNFDPKRSPWNMPELSWYWGYPLAWALMLGVGVATAVYFRRKGWLGGETVSSRAPQAELAAREAPAALRPEDDPTD